ncbi:tumor necrosis factor ligand superfamily member 15 [Rana temporaria]|uniref:tumor necrosis factor ligand superfamily member 15 n=1 Tax=Rana temporaria TaxID=8407 RepID=UPI001AACC185|nr:tumor necrosis factor ligand superfamily member 15 [Rana temporaria]
MEGNVDVGVEMLPEEATRRLIGAQRAQDRRLRRLQWAVTVSSLALLGLFCLTLYQTFGNLPPPPPGKTERSPQMSGNPIWKDLKPMAHLTAPGPYLKAEPNDTFLHWQSSIGLAFVKDGMKYENKSIHIKKNGYYFVYAQVSLKTPHESNKDPFELKIIKENNNYPEAEVLFIGKIHKNGQQTYLAGLVNLRNGDRLKVNVSFIDQVDIYSEHKTFFGAFWVM